MALPNGSAEQGERRWRTGKGGYRGGVDAALGDFLELLGKAVLSGIAASVVLALLALGLATTAQRPGRSPTTRRRAPCCCARDAGASSSPRPRSRPMSRSTSPASSPARAWPRPSTTRARDWVEGVYVFPLPENAAVDRLWLRIGDRLIEGQVKEKEEARRVYAAGEERGQEGRARRAAAAQPLHQRRGQHRPRRERARARSSTSRRSPTTTASTACASRLRSPRATSTCRKRGQIPFSTAENRDLTPLSSRPAPRLRRRPAAASNPVADRRRDRLRRAAARACRAPTTRRVVEKESGTRTRALPAEGAGGGRPRLRTGVGAAGAAAAAGRGVHGDARRHRLRAPHGDAAAATAAGRRRGAPAARNGLRDRHLRLDAGHLDRSRPGKRSSLASRTLAPRDRFNVVEFNSATRPMWPDALPGDGRQRRERRAQWVREAAAPTAAPRWRGRWPSRSTAARRPASCAR